MARIPFEFGEMRPDDAAHASQGMPLVNGAYASASGYRPIGDFAEFAPALSGTFNGGGAFIAIDGTTRLVAGTSADLYTLTAGAWTSTTSGGISANDRWRFTQFGDDVICVNGGAPVGYSLTANSAALLAGSPPTARFCATLGDFVVLGGVDGNNNIVAWCGQGNSTVWTPGTLQAGQQPIYAGGKIMGLTSGEVCHIVQRFQVVQMSYTAEPTDPFQFDPISINDGCIAEGSFAQAGALYFFYGDRGFTMFDGTQFRPIGGERIDRMFRNAYSLTEMQSLWAVADPTRSVVIWAMPQRTWMYNWVLDRWTIADIPISAVFSSFTTGTTLEQYSALYGNLDTAPYSLDDPRFSGGSPRLTAVHADGRFGALTGSNIAAKFILSTFEPIDGRRGRLRRVEPVTDATSGLTLTIASQLRLGDAPTERSFSQINRLGEMPVRANGRHFRATLDIAAGATWDYLQAMIFDFEPGGRA